MSKSFCGAGKKERKYTLLTARTCGNQLFGAEASHLPTSAASKCAASAPTKNIRRKIYNRYTSL
jgi:hypothetical protein